MMPWYPVPQLMQCMATAPVALWGIERLNLGHNNPTVQVRRGSDNGTVDCYSQADIIAYCAGTNGFVTLLWDQTGNVNHLANATAAQQPKIYDAVNGLLASGSMPVMSFDTSNDILTVSGNVGIPTGSPALTTVQLIGSWDAASVGWSVGAPLTNDGTGNTWQGERSNATTVLVGFHVGSRSFGATDLTIRRCYLVYSKAAAGLAGASTVRQNGLTLTEVLTSVPSQPQALVVGQTTLGDAVSKKSPQTVSVHGHWNAQLTGSELAALEQVLERMRNVTSFYDVLGSNLVLEYDARFAIVGTPDSQGNGVDANWTDRRRGIKLASWGLYPNVGPDGSYFRGLPVLQCYTHVPDFTDESLSNNWVQANLGTSAVTGDATAPSPPIWVNGSRPYMLWVGRIRDFPDGNYQWVGTRLENASRLGNTIGMFIQIASITLIVANNAYLTVPFTDTGVHVFEGWVDTTGTMNLAVDGAILGSSTGNTALVEDSGVISIGGNVLCQHVSDSSYALNLCCRTVPTVQQRVEVFEMARSIWGSPAMKPPLPASTVEWWWGDAGASATQAVGQKAGIILPAINTPSVGIDLGYFKNRTVYKTATGGHSWRGVDLSTGILAGTRPWLYLVGRLRDSGGFTTLVGIGKNTTTTSRAAEFRSATNAWQVNSATPTNWYVQDGTADTAVHAFKSWTASTTANLTIDGVNTTSGGASALANDIIAVSFGCVVENGGGSSNASIALFLICSSKPTTQEEAALDLWARATYGIA